MNHILTALLLSFSLVTFAQADSPIGTIEGSRTATPAEKAFIAKMIAALKKAVPAIPAGWELSEELAPAADMDVGADSEKHGLLLDYTWHIASKDLAQKEATLLKKMTDTQNATRDESGLPKGTAPLQARMEELSAKLGEAAAKGDTVTMQKYSAEMEKLGKQMAAAQDGAAVPLEEQRKIMADTKASIYFNINVLQSGSLGDAKPVSTPAAFAFRTERDPNDTEAQREGFTTLLFGPWKKDVSGDFYEVKPNPARKHPSVNSVIITIRADTKRAEGLIKSLNAAEIQGWLK